MSRVRLLSKLKPKNPKKLLRNSILAFIVCLVISGLASALGGHRHPLHYPIAIGCDLANLLGGPALSDRSGFDPISTAAAPAWHFNQRNHQSSDYRRNGFCESYYWNYVDDYYPNIACAARMISKEEFDRLIAENDRDVSLNAGRLYKCEGLGYQARQVLIAGKSADRPLISHFEIADPSYYQSAFAGPYEPSAEINKLVSQMGLTAVGKELFFESRPQFTDGEVCQKAGLTGRARGCFTSFGSGKTRITLTDDLDDQAQRVEVAAHELLHGVYYDLSETNRLEVNEWIDTAYQRNKSQLDRRLRPYGKLAADDLYSELHSFIGSTITDIPAPLETHYGRYFTDRVGRIVNAKPTTATTTTPPPANSDSGEWGTGYTDLPDIDLNLSCIAKLGVLAEHMEARGATRADIATTLTAPENIQVLDQEYPGCFNEWLPTIEAWQATGLNPATTTPSFDSFWQSQEQQKLERRLDCLERGGDWTGSWCNTYRINF